MNSDALAAVIDRYRAEGYDVIAHPRGDRIPPFLAGFQPDLIATKGDEGVVVEVKENRVALSRDAQLARIAGIVNSQPGWRLDVEVMEPETSVDKAAEEAPEPSDLQLARILDTADDLVEHGYPESACVVAWSGLEAAMRRIRDVAELYGKTSPAELMRTLYGNGIFDAEQFKRLKESYKIRSQIVHGFVPARVDPEQVRFVTATARYLAYDPAESAPQG